MYLYMYLARYEVQCKRYKPNSKSIAHLSNVKIRVMHIHYIGRLISIDLSKYICTIYLCNLNVVFKDLRCIQTLWINIEYTTFKFM